MRLTPSLIAAALGATALPLAAQAAEAQFVVSIPGVQAGARVPDEFTFCRPSPTDHVALGQNLSLPVRWQHGPAGTQSYAISMTDADVPQDAASVNKPGATIAAAVPRAVFYHWLLVDIPAERRELPRGEDSNAVVPHGKPAGPAAVGRRGVNDYTGFLASDPNMAGTYAGYDGPCPPWNDLAVHHYTLTAYALDVSRLPMPDPFDGKAFAAALPGHVLARGSVTMTYTTYR